jgi:hypothetical protein
VVSMTRGSYIVKVDKVGKENRTPNAIIAQFDAPTHRLPKTVDVIVSKKVVAVPVVATAR